MKTTSSCVYDVIALVETNLSADINNSELGLDTFSIYRSDRSEQTSLKSSGGGVLLAINKNMPSHQIQVSDDSIECVYVRVILGDKYIIIGLVYIPLNNLL